MLSKEQLWMLLEIIQTRLKEQIYILFVYIKIEIYQKPENHIVQSVAKWR